MIKKILFSLMLIQCLLYDPFLIQQVSSSIEYDLDVYLTVYLAKNGTAYVHINITSWSLLNFNLSIPKTAKSLNFEGDLHFVRFISSETGAPFGLDYLEIFPKNEGNTTKTIDVSYLWPDCAVSFNGSYYVGCNELLKLYPDYRWTTTFVSVIFPEGSRIISGFNQEHMKMENFNNRTVISYEVHGYRNTECHEYLGAFVFEHMYYEDFTQRTSSKNTETYFPKDLSPWIDTTTAYCEAAYLALQSLTEMRESYGMLKIFFVPYLYIDSAFGRPVLAFYNRSEDAVYFPSNWVFSLSYGQSAIRVLSHEIAHSFQPQAGLPRFFEEGSADYLSMVTLEALGFHKYVKEMATLETVCKNPITDVNFNATDFFGWDKEPDYAYAFYIVYALVNRTNPSLLRNFFNLCEQKSLNFKNSIENEEDRYNLFVYYLGQSANKDLKGFFEEFGLTTSPEKINNELFLNFASISLTVILVLLTLRFISISFLKKSSISEKVKGFVQFTLLVITLIFLLVPFQAEYYLLYHSYITTRTIILGAMTMYVLFKIASIIRKRRHEKASMVHTAM
jgi:hypothetical protein